jgi:hypothetical protein
MLSNEAIENICRSACANSDITFEWWMSNNEGTAPHSKRNPI